MSRFIEKCSTHRSRLWLLVFGIMSMGLLSFGMCDDNDSGFDCDDSDCDTDCDTDNDGDCDCDHHDHEHDKWWDMAQEQIIYDQHMQSVEAKRSKQAKSSPVKSSAPVRNVSNELKNELRMKRITSFIFKHKQIQVGFSSGKLQEQNVNQAYQLLKNQAFTKIQLVPVMDIGPQSHITAGKVKEISIGGRNLFGPTELFAYDSPIVIYYHDKKEVTVPFAAKILKKMDYQIVYDQLKELGFSNVHKCPKRDIIFGLLSKDGEIEEVSIAGNSHFKANTTYKFDVEIKIHYHTPVTARY